MSGDIGAAFLMRDRTQRLRAIVELLMCNVGHDEDEPSHRDAYGNKKRRGGYHPTPQEDPEVSGQRAWRHKWQSSKASKLLARDATYDEASHWGKIFRSRTGVPRILFDQLLSEAQSYPELPNHSAGDGQSKRGPSCIPIRMKLYGALSWLRNGGTIAIHADAVDIDVQTLRRFIAVARTG